MDTIFRWRTASQSYGVKPRSETVANFGAMPPSPNWKKKAYSKQAKTENRKPQKRVETRNCLVCKKQGHLVKECRDPRKDTGSEIENLKKTVLKVVDGAATDTRASAATSGAQATTGASHEEMRMGRGRSSDRNHSSDSRE